MGKRAARAAEETSVLSSRSRSTQRSPCPSKLEGVLNCVGKYFPEQRRDTWCDVNSACYVPSRLSSIKTRSCTSPVSRALSASNTSVPSPTSADRRVQSCVHSSMTGVPATRACASVMFPVCARRRFVTNAGKAAPSLMLQNTKRLVHAFRRWAREKSARC